MGLFSSDSKTTSTNVDNRSVADFSGGGINAGAGAHVVTNDPAVLGQMASYAASSAQGMTAQGTDGVRAVAALGADTIKSMGASVTDLYESAGKNSSSAWGHTLDVAGDLMSKTFDATSKTLSVSQALADKAMTSYQPADSKMGDAIKWAAIAGAVVIGLAFAARLKG